MGNACSGEKERTKRSAMDFSSAYGPSHGALAPHGTSNTPSPRSRRRCRSHRQSYPRSTRHRHSSRASSSILPDEGGYPSGLPRYAPPQSRRQEPSYSVNFASDLRAPWIGDEDDSDAENEVQTEAALFAKRLRAIYEKQTCFKLILEEDRQLIPRCNAFDPMHAVPVDTIARNHHISYAGQTRFALIIDEAGEIIRVPLGRRKKMNVARAYATGVNANISYRDDATSNDAFSRPHNNSSLLPSIPTVLWGRILQDFLPYRDGCAALSLCRAIRYQASKFVTNVTITCVTELDVATARCFPSVTAVSVCYTEMVPHDDTTLLEAVVNTVPFLEAFPNLATVHLDGVAAVPNVGTRVFMLQLCESFRSKSLSQCLDLRCNTSQGGYTCKKPQRFPGYSHCQACHGLFRYFPMHVASSWLCGAGPKVCIDDKVRCRIIMARPGGAKFLESESHMRYLLGRAVKWTSVQEYLTYWARGARITEDITRALHSSGSVIDDKVFYIESFVIERLQTMTENGLDPNRMGKKETLSALFGDVYKDCHDGRPKQYAFDPEEADMLVRVGICRSDVEKLMKVGLSIELRDFSYLCSGQFLV